MSKERKVTTKQIVFAAMAIALATVIATVIKLPSLPNGGSVTLFSMLVVTMVGYWYGPFVGITAAVGFGILQFITGPYVVHPLQVVIDYPLAFGALGISGFFSGKKNGLLKEFGNFIQRGNAIDMAVGIIVGSVMTGIVNSLVKDVIMPPIGLLLGKVDFAILFVVL